MDCRDRIDAAYQGRERWTTMSVLNVARMGTFSSDRSMRGYCEMIWNAQMIPDT